MFVRVDNSEGEKRLYGSLADNVEFVQTLPRSLEHLRARRVLAETHKDNATNLKAILSGLSAAYGSTAGGGADIDAIQG